MSTSKTDIPQDPEELLWSLASSHRSVSSGEQPTKLSDDQLLAYRSGQVSESERRPIEKALAHDSALRARLIELAGVHPDAPSAETRARALAAAPGAAERPADSGGGGRVLSWPGAASRRKQLTLLAATLVTVLGAFLVLQPGSHEPLPDGFGYSLSTTGLTEVRSATSTERLQALPQTLVRITAAPTGQTMADLDFGLYRRDGDRLERLDIGKGIELEVVRGTAELRARAVDLVGDKPGTYSLVVAVGRAGALPRSGVVLPDAADPSIVLLEQELTILPPQDL